MASAGRGKKAKEAAAQAKRALDRLLAYIGRLGPKRAAGRLGAKVADIERWVERKALPPSKVAAALTLNKLGGAVVPVRGSQVKKVVEKLGLKKAAALTGQSQKALREALEKAPRARIYIKRPALDELAKKGAKEAGKLLGISAADFAATKRPPKTAATLRLQKLVETYGLDQSASFLGIPQDRLKRWIRDNIPRSWEVGLNQAIGVRPDQEPEPEAVKAPRKPHTARQIASAWKKIERRNAKVEPRHRISRRVFDQWVALGTLEKNLTSLEEKITEAERSRVKKTPPAPPLPPDYPGQKPRPRPPESFRKPVEEAFDPEALRNFLELRAYYWVNDIPNVHLAKVRYKDAPFGAIVKYSKKGAIGYCQYTKVHEFAHQTDLTRLGTFLTERAQKLWERPKKHHYGHMNIKLCYAAQGLGNPFYEDAFVKDPDKISWSFSPFVRIVNRNEIEFQIRKSLDDAYAQVGRILLYFEHVEMTRIENRGPDIPRKHRKRRR